MYQMVFDVVLEFATPLLSLHEMHDGSLANLSESAMKIERDKFKEVLTKILCYPDMRDKCQDKYLIVNYRGTTSGLSVCQDVIMLRNDSTTINILFYYSRSHPLQGTIRTECTVQ